MKISSVISLAALLAVSVWAEAAEEKKQDLTSTANEVAQKYLLVDTHIDVPIRLEQNYADVTRATQGGDFDYPRAHAGGLNIPFMSIYIPASYESDGGGAAMADRLIDRVEAMVGRAPDKFAIPHSVAEARQQVEV